MHKSELIADILKRIKDIKHLTSDAQVAKVLDMTRNNLYGFKKRKKIPNDALQIFCSHEKIRLDYIINGTLPIYEYQTGQGEMHKIQAIPVAESSAAYHSTPATNIEENLELINKTSQILNSRTIYYSALRSNIEAFHHALVCEEKLDLASQRIDDLEDRLKTVENRLLKAKVS